MDSLKNLYKEMYELTEPECRLSCKCPHSCCSEEYCIMAIEYAKEEYNITLRTTDNEKLPLMGEHGCTVEPYLRPMCTMHTCDINSIGVKQNDQEWTDKYFMLRDKIVEKEYLRINNEENIDFKELSKKEVEEIWEEVDKAITQMKD